MTIFSTLFCAADSDAGNLIKNDSISSFHSLPRSHFLIVNKLTHRASCLYMLSSQSIQCPTSSPFTSSFCQCRRLRIAIVIVDNGIVIFNFEYWTQFRTIHDNGKMIYNGIDFYCTRALFSHSSQQRQKKGKICSNRSSNRKKGQKVNVVSTILHER